MDSFLHLGHIKTITFHHPLGLSQRNAFLVRFWLILLLLLQLLLLLLHHHHLYHLLFSWSSLLKEVTLRLTLKWNKGRYWQKMLLHCFNDFGKTFLHLLHLSAIFRFFSFSFELHLPSSFFGLWLDLDFWYNGNYWTWKVLETELTCFDNFLCFHCPLLAIVPYLCVFSKIKFKPNVELFWKISIYWPLC